MEASLNQCFFVFRLYIKNTYTQQYKTKRRLHRHSEIYIVGYGWQIAKVLGKTILKKGKKTYNACKKTK
jgi:hypothetical protein